VLIIPIYVLYRRLNLLEAWNEFLFASTLVTRADIRPASVGLSTLISEVDTPVQRLLAAGLIFSIRSK
jgi:multiple sugar transport system permease protein